MKKVFLLTFLLSSYMFANEYSCTVKKTCKQMSSCDEAYFYLNVCGKKSLDRDKDGIPCESICKK